jgi:hypothetical protein
MMTVAEVYRSVIEEVIQSAKKDFKESGVSEELLTQLQTVQWCELAIF